MAFGSVSYEPCPKTNFFTFYFRWREGVPTSVLGSQPIIWLLSSSSWCLATWVRLPCTNMCWYPLCDLHSFLTVTLWWLVTVHSSGRIVLILFLSSQWDTTWHYRKNPTNTNALKLKTAQYQLAGIYIKEQTEYIQNQIDKIRNSVEDRQSRIARQTINEVSRRKNTTKAKLKAANQQERIKLWKQHFENLLGNPPEITHEPITRIISKQLDIKLGPFTQEELDSVLRKIKNRKAAGLDEIPPEVWKTRQFDDILLRHCNAVYNQNPIDRWMKGCILPFPKKGDLGLAKNYRGITLTSIAAKIYNALLRNRIEPKIDNILRKNQNGFRRNRSTTSLLLTIRRILEGVRAKNLQATLILLTIPRPSIPFTEERWNKSY